MGGGAAAGAGGGAAAGTANAANAASRTSRADMLQWIGVENHLRVLQHDHQRAYRRHWAAMQRARGTLSYGIPSHRVRATDRYGRPKGGTKEAAGAATRAAVAAVADADDAHALVENHVDILTLADSATTTTTTLSTTTTTTTTRQPMDKPVQHHDTPLVPYLDLYELRVRCKRNIRLNNRLASIYASPSADHATYAPDHAWTDQYHRFHHQRRAFDHAHTQRQRYADDLALVRRCQHGNALADRHGHAAFARWHAEKRDMISRRRVIELKAAPTLPLPQISKNNNLDGDGPSSSSELSSELSRTTPVPPSSRSLESSRRPYTARRIRSADATQTPAMTTPATTTMALLPLPPPRPSSAASSALSSSFVSLALPLDGSALGFVDSAFDSQASPPTAPAALPRSPLTERLRSARHARSMRHAAAHKSSSFNSSSTSSSTTLSSLSHSQTFLPVLLQPTPPPARSASSTSPLTPSRPRSRELNATWHAMLDAVEAQASLPRCALAADGHYVVAHESSA